MNAAIGHRRRGRRFTGRRFGGRRRCRRRGGRHAAAAAATVVVLYCLHAGRPVEWIVVDVGLWRHGDVRKDATFCNNNWQLNHSSIR